MEDNNGMKESGGLCDEGTHSLNNICVWSAALCPVSRTRSFSCVCSFVSFAYFQKNGNI
jgi:hypothetical protein